MAYDARGHGGTFTTDDSNLRLSSELAALTKISLNGHRLLSLQRQRARRRPAPCGCGSGSARLVVRGDEGRAGRAQHGWRHCHSRRSAGQPCTLSACLSSRLACRQATGHYLYGADKPS